ncbi:hypothetical protein V7S43_007234 [Phytophthora oleae]|uniref:Uncharacterized protein n=1 Tax=Phytophthora oleae TaxID=2107226 RepID=A0ABD3FMY5_9STRA
MTHPPAQAAAKPAAQPSPAAKAIPASPRSSAAFTTVAPAKTSTNILPRAASKTIAAKRKPMTPKPATKRRKKDFTVSNVPETPVNVPENPAADVPDSPAADTDTTERQVTEMPAVVADTTEATVLEVADAPNRVPDTANGVTMDEFDSEDFLAALRRDHLFTFTDTDDLNIGRGDWLLSLDSDEEGDEDSILLDEAENHDEEDEASATVEDHRSDYDAGQDGGVDEVPMEFDLTSEQLDLLKLMDRTIMMSTT